VELRRQKKFGGKVMWLVVLLIFLIMIQFQIRALKQAWLAGF
jgi:hypothetical protein